MACATLKRSLEFDPVHSHGRPSKRRRCVPMCVSPPATTATPASTAKPQNASSFGEIAAKMTPGKELIYTPLAQFLPVSLYSRPSFARVFSLSFHAIYSFANSLFPPHLVLPIIALVYAFPPREREARARKKEREKKKKKRGRRAPFAQTYIYTQHIHTDP